MRAAHRLSPWLFASPTALLFFFHLPLTGAAASPPLEARVVARVAGADPRFFATPLQVHVATPVEATIELRSARGAIVPLPAGATVRWLQIVPHDEHTTTAAPNTTSTAFSNNVLFGPRHGQWIGFDRIEYDARPLPAPATTPASTTAATSSAASPASAAPLAITITGPAITSRTGNIGAQVEIVPQAGQVVTTATVVVPWPPTDLTNPAGTQASYSCSLSGFSNSLQRWDIFREDHPTPVFRLKPTPTELTGTFVW